MPKQTTAPEAEFESIPLSQIQSNPHQPRKDFDEAALNELALSIQKHGRINISQIKWGNWVVDLRTGWNPSEGGRRTPQADRLEDEGARKAFLSLILVLEQHLDSGKTSASVQKNLTHQIDQAFQKAGGLKKLEEESAKFEAEHDMNHIAEGMISKVFDQIPKKDRGAITKTLRRALEKKDKR